MRTFIDEKFIKSFVLPDKKTTYFDQNVKNLAIIAHPTTANYYFIKKINKKFSAVKIGTIYDITLTQAQKQIPKILKEQSRRVSKKTVTPKITLQDVWEAYIKAKKIRGDSLHGIGCATSRWNLHVPDELKKMAYNKINPFEFEKNNLAIGAKGIKRTANLLTVDLTAAYNYFCKVNAINMINPLRGVTRFYNNQRERVLSLPEIKRFFNALNESESSTFIDFVKVALFTGKRKSRILAMRWDQIDLNNKTWNIPAAINKNKSLDIVFLDDIVVQLLKNRRNNSPWVFPSEDSKSHYKAPENAWHTLLSRAMLTDVVMHDLRRTLASVMADNNCSLHIIGQVLNHKSLSSTPIYARVQQQAKREALSNAVNIIAAAGGLSPNKHTENCLRINNSITRNEILAKQVLDFIISQNCAK